MELKHILVIEDTSKHQKDAIRVIGDDRLMLEPADDLRWAISHIRYFAAHKNTSGTFGVLTDLYFPAAFDDKHGDLAPLGLLVMMECQKLGVPCVIVTAGYHHGPKYHQIFSALNEMGLPRMVDSSNNSEVEAEEKNWKKGLEELEALAAKIGGG